MKRIAIYLYSVIVGVLSISAQEYNDTYLTHYYAMPAAFNPAAAGVDARLNIVADGRLQWTGLSDNPRAASLSVDMPLRLGKYRFGAGVVGRYNSVGTMRYGTAAMQFSYQTNEISVGVRAGYVGGETDVEIPLTDSNGGSIDLGLGLWWNKRNFYLGGSVLHLNEPKFTFTSNDESKGENENADETALEYRIKRTAFFTGGGNISLKDSFIELQPSIFVRTDFTHLRAEATARVRYRQMLTAGIGYRHDDAVIGILGGEFGGLFVMYSYGFNISGAGKESHGSHEIVAGYRVKLNVAPKRRFKHKSIRIL